jgi:hypothetical protein
VSHPQTRIPDVPRSSGGRARRQSVGRIVVGERVPLRLQGPLFGESKAESHFREMFDRHIVTVFHSVGKREREQLCPALHSNSVTVMDNGWAEWVAAVTSTGAVSQAAIHGHDGCVRVFILLVQSTFERAGATPCMVRTFILGAHAYPQHLRISPRRFHAFARPPKSPYGHAEMCEWGRWQVVGGWSSW